MFTSPSTIPFKPAPFIVGVGRSGTTLLRLMLDAHPDLAIPGETHFVPGLLTAAAQTGEPRQTLEWLTAQRTWPNLGLEPDAAAAAFARLDPFTPGDAVRAIFALYAARFGKPRWGDKTPTYRASMSEIAAALPEATFLHIIRDGRDVALSYLGLWFGPGDDIEAQARFWVAEIARARAQAASLPRYLEVRFEDLVSRPEAEVHRLCDALDLAFNPAMLTYDKSARERMSEYVQTFGPQGSAPVSLEDFLAIHDRTQIPPDAGRVGRWRTEMSADDSNLYERIAGPMLEELGYL